MIRAWAVWDRSRKIGLLLIAFLVITVVGSIVVIIIWTEGLHRKSFQSMFVSVRPQPVDTAVHMPLNLDACGCINVTSGYLLPITSGVIFALCTGQFG